MVEFEKIQSTSVTIGDESYVELRIDWNNDRHQRVTLQDRSPNAVAKALHELFMLVGNDISNGDL